MKRQIPISCAWMVKPKVIDVGMCQIASYYKRRMSNNNPENMVLEMKEVDEMKRYRIRRLTPRECWRLMGFSDEDFEAAAGVNSNTQLYAQAGNSIVVNVLEAIFGQMVDQENAAHEGERPAEIEDPPHEEKEPIMVAMDREERGDIVERFRESLMDSDKVKLYGSINSRNYMIHIDDAVGLLKQCIGAEG